MSQVQQQCSTDLDWGCLPGQCPWEVVSVTLVHNFHQVLAGPRRRLEGRSSFFISFLQALGAP